MKLLHTADWHLGHTLHDHTRDYEHDRFLKWLLDCLAENAVDALLVSGDIFDTQNPPAQAQKAWYRFCADAKKRLPRLEMVFAGGNHDSAARLEAPHPLFEAFGIRVIGSMPRDDHSRLDFERVILPLHGADGEVAAWCVAMPYLRPVDLPPAENGDDADPLLEGVRRSYSAAMAVAEKRRSPHQAIIAMGHAYLVGGRVSELSERRILGGNQHAIPAAVFPKQIAYVALGHLHLAQVVGGSDRIRYAGAPLPLAVNESTYPHQVCLVETDGASLRSVQAIRVPSFVEILRVPADGPAPLDQVLRELEALEIPGHRMDSPERPYLEVRVLLSRPEPTLRRQVEQTLDGKPVRLLRIATEKDGHGLALGDSARLRDLADLRPDDIFRNRYQRDHEGEPPPELFSAFREIVTLAEEEQAR
jgi:exonuclease SbcD